MIARYPSVLCLLLNACYSLRAFPESLAPVTIGMDSPASDAAAIEFSRGFYDAVGANKSIDIAIAEGKSAADLKGLLAGLPLVVISRSGSPEG
ncbi:MAG: hypothetical protein IPP07_17775 [Holophagales bacterium]|nr:hypothetical protein [Holophagales bacterium]MBK9966622.1 hypothetical protein [Holophagales bacterium]